VIFKKQAYEELNEIQDVKNFPPIKVEKDPFLDMF